METSHPSILDLTEEQLGAIRGGNNPPQNQEGDPEIPLGEGDPDQPQ